MLTNKLDVKINKENIDRDFDIYYVKKDETTTKNRILDVDNLNVKALAVQYTYGSKALVLFKKNDPSINNFRDYLNSKEEFQDIVFKKINIFDEEECKQNFKTHDLLLVQLLINSLSNYKTDEYSYNNISGRLLYGNPNWIYKKDGKIKYIRFIRIAVISGLYLTLDLESYKETNDKKNIYVIDNNGTFRRQLNSDSNLPTYKKGSMSGSKFTVDYYNIKSFDKFKQSKVGVLAQFLIDVKERLSDYLTMELSSKEGVEKYTTRDLKKFDDDSLTKCINILNSKGVVICDENNTETSKQVADNLLKELKEYANINAVIGKLDKDKFNFRIIHNQQYFADNNLKDDHQDYLKDYVVQHVTEEDMIFSDDDSLSPSIKKIIEEIIIKDDIKNKKLSIFNWKSLNQDKTWYFVREYKNKDDYGKYTYSTYYRLAINPNGELHFDSLELDPNKSNMEEQLISMEFNKYSHIRSIGHELEGLMYCDINNIYPVVQTSEIPTPNVLSLYKTLKMINPNMILDKDDILSSFKEFQEAYDVDSDVIDNWVHDINDLNYELTCDDVRRIIRLKTHIGKGFNEFLIASKGIIISGEFRNKKNNDEYEVDNLIGINYKVIENEYDKGTYYLEYFVGDKSKKQSYPVACKVRRICLGTNKDSLSIDFIVRLLAVEFVRNGNYTVIPFPFKYLREVIKLSYYL